jgi:hypothetical protein
MRGILRTLLTSALIAALATPATLSAAADRDEAGPARTVEASSVVAVTPAPAVPVLSIRASVDRAVSAVLAKEPVAQGRTPSTRRGKTAIRAQGQGGGGKTGMIIGLVTTLVGVGATIYMVKEMQKATDENK